MTFRHLLEKRELQKKVFEAVNARLEGEGMLWRGGGIIDATIIEVPSSTQNTAKSRDLEMKQTRKGNERHFGLKAHIGCDVGTGMLYSVAVTGANVHDLEKAHALVRPDDDAAYGDAGYVGVEKREAVKGAENLSESEWRINRRTGKELAKDKELYEDVMKRLDWVSAPRWGAEVERQKSKVHGKVEDNLYLIKRLFKYDKARYGGLAKNGAREQAVMPPLGVLFWQLPKTAF